MRLRSSFLFASALAAGCSAPAGTLVSEPAPRKAPAVEAATPPPVQEGELSVADVQAALASGDLEAAHARLTSLLCRQYLAEARASLKTTELDRGLDALDRALELMPKNREAQALKREASEQFYDTLLEQAAAALAEGEPEDALSLTDRALTLRPEEPSALVLRGRGFFDLGLRVQEISFFEDSLRNFTAASAVAETAESLLGASRAAFYLQRNDEALAFARRAQDKLPARPRSGDLRIVAEATFAAYRAEQTTTPLSEDAEDLFRETEDVLYRMVGVDSQDAWAWRELANLSSWHGMHEEAQGILEEGLGRIPTDAALHERLYEVARERGGDAEVQRFYSEFTRRYPQVALGHWYSGRARFGVALDRLNQDYEDDGGRAAATARLVPEFQEAEASFARARELAPDFSDPCLGYEIICRNGLGWSYYHSGDFDAARDAFFSMEDLKEGGLGWELDGSLPSGVASLEWVASAFFAAQQDSARSDLEKARAMEKAAKIYDFLHEYEPQVTKWANNSGFVNRDVAVLLHDEARNLEAKLARDDLAEERAAELAEEGRKMLARARELMDKSYRSYVDAAALAPEDVRIVNDTGLILTYYLQTRLDVAERYLMEAVRLGEEQAADPDLTLDARYELENALGDAYQNLGVLHLQLTGNVVAARGWFEKALAIGPDPRPVIDDGYLPQCEAVVRGELEAPLVTEENRWDAPLRLPKE